MEHAVELRIENYQSNGPALAVNGCFWFPHAGHDEKNPEVCLHSQLLSSLLSHLELSKQFHCEPPKQLLRV